MRLEQLVRDLTQDAYFGYFALPTGPTPLYRLTPEEVTAWMHETIIPRSIARDGPLSRFLVIGGTLYTNGQTWREIRPGQIANMGWYDRQGQHTEGGWRVVVPDPADVTKEETYFDLNPEWIERTARGEITLVADGGVMINTHLEKRREYRYTLVANDLTKIGERTL